MKSFSLYVHIPFCLHKCPYCDFNSYAVSAVPEKQYTSALLAELDFRATFAEWKERPLQSIYFGGGTPSLFQPASLRKILVAASFLFPFSPDIEITIEANPGTIDADMLKGYRDCGINRISLGAQSLNPDLLKTLGRIHSAQQVEIGVEMARIVGFDNINLDLIYGLPSQSLEQWKGDIEGILRCRPRHISAYGLTIEKGTPFHSRYKRNRLALPSEDLIVEMMQELFAALDSAGFNRYELSNFALPGYEARHNLVYWNGGDYLGLGAGAHSYFCDFEGFRRISARRWANHTHPNKYIRHAVAYGQAESWCENLGVKDLIFEFFFLGLRKTSGVNLFQFEEAFGTTIEQVYPTLTDLLTEEGLLERRGDTLALSERGLLLADSVIANFAGVDSKIIPLPKATGSKPDESQRTMPKAANQ